MPADPARFVPCDCKAPHTCLGGDVIGIYVREQFSNAGVIVSDQTLALLLDYDLYV